MTGPAGQCNIGIFLSPVDDLNVRFYNVNINRKNFVRQISLLLHTKPKVISPMVPGSNILTVLQNMAWKTFWSCVTYIVILRLPHQKHAPTGLLNKNFQLKIVIIFLPINLTYVLGAQKNRLIETVLLSTQNICFG